MRRAVRRVVYFLDLFPAVTDPFILNELLTLERRGVALEIYSWRPNPDDRGQMPPELGRLKAPITFLEQLEFRPAEKLTALAWVLARHPVRTLRWGAHYALRGGRERWYWAQALCLARRLEREGVNQIHAHFLSVAGKMATTVAQCTGIPFTFTLHAQEIYDPASTGELQFRCAAAADVVTVSEYNRRWLAERHGIPSERVHVVHCGIDPSFFGLNGEHAAEASEPLVVCVARLQPIKGLEFLVEACASLKRRGYRFRCAILGEGPERPALERRIAEQQLGGVVELMGQQSQEVVRQSLWKAVLFVLPSRSEALSVSTMEAMACGVPAVVTNVGGMAELVEHERCGLLVPPQDAGALAVAIARLLDDPARRARFGAAAREKVLSEFTLDRQAGQLLEIWGRGSGR